MEARMADDPNDRRITRRKALSRLGAAGALVWTVPTPAVMKKAADIRQLVGR